MSLQLARLMLGTIIAICYISTVSAMAVSEDNLASEMQNSETLRAVSTGINQFAVEFYKKTSDNLTDNLICSPISASIVLSMTAHGAAGNTEKQMRTGLHLPNNRAIGLQGFQLLIDSINNIKDVKLSIALKIFIDNNFKVKQEFKDIVANSFRSEIQDLNLGNYDEASETINTWCKEKTNNLIKDIMKRDYLTDAVMVLVSAVYFKGIWEKKFNPEATLNKSFYINEHISNDVLMMTQRNKFNYGEIPDLDASYIELPYMGQNQSDSISMFIIRPNQINGLKNAHDNIEKVNFEQLHDNTRWTDIILSMPKFKAESTINLKPILNEMGMNDMFNNANFSGISNDSPSVSKVVQKAIIEVNEEGSKAAASTAVIGTLRTSMSLRPDPIRLTIDRPFIYAIYHVSTNSILFQGHILQLPA